MVGTNSSSTTEFHTKILGPKSREREKSCAKISFFWYQAMMNYELYEFHLKDIFEIYSWTVKPFQVSFLLFYSFWIGFFEI